jgi:hypothetical protein
MSDMVSIGSDTSFLLLRLGSVDAYLLLSCQTFSGHPAGRRRSSGLIMLIYLDIPLTMLFRCCLSRNRGLLKRQQCGQDIDVLS